MYDAELAKKEANKAVVRALILLLDMDEVASKDEEYIKQFFHLNPEVVTALLNMDAMALAEAIAGKSYKDDEGVALIGMGLQIKLNGFKDMAMKSLQDTRFSMTPEELVGLLSGKGFEQIYQEEFERNSTHNRCKDTLNVWLHRQDGVLLIFDTYDGGAVNGGCFHYCWSPEGGDLSKRYDVTSSGGWESVSDPEWRNKEGERPTDLYWRGNHDCREGMFRAIQRLKEAGTLLSPWPACTGHGVDLPLSTSVDYEKAKEAGAKPWDYTLVDETRKRRYDAFPEDVRALLNFTFKVK